MDTSLNIWSCILDDIISKLSFQFPNIYRIRYSIFGIKMIRISVTIFYLNIYYFRLMTLIDFFTRLDQNKWSIIRLLNIIFFWIFFYLFGYSKTSHKNPLIFLTGMAFFCVWDFCTILYYLFFIERNILVYLAYFNSIHLFLAIPKIMEIFQFMTHDQ